ncbi:hypothetical protein BC941DRAFT_464662 [Chlamydoabsidia padenii]|nr:hypothetical protein BC941DRAFT_464662 [Chlamydoabsidia padenii]
MDKLNNSDSEGVVEQMETEEGAGNSSFDTEFDNLRQAIQTKNFDKAIQSFEFLQSNFMDNTLFQDYLLEIASQIYPEKITELAEFFEALPCVLQSNIVDYVTERSTGRHGFRVVFDYIQAYPRFAYKYLIKAIQILLQMNQNGTPEEKSQSIPLLVTDLFPRLCKMQPILSYADTEPLGKARDWKHYIILPWTEFETYISTGQQYYIGKRQWDELAKFTCMMVSCCGYSGFEQLDSVSHTIRFQHLKEHRQKIRVDPKLKPKSISTTLTGMGKSYTPTRTKDEATQLMVSATVMCEYMVIVSQFVSFGYDYYMSVCGKNDTRRSSDLEKTCLIPICAFKPASSKGDSYGNNDNKNLSTSTTPLPAPLYSLPSSSSSPSPITSPATIESDIPDYAFSGRQTEEATSPLPSSSSVDNSNLKNDHSHKRARMDLVNNGDDRGQGLSAECIHGVDQALQILSKAADCLRHMVDLWQWAKMNCTKSDTLKPWESELNRVIDNYSLPFDIKNAILLLQSDLALSSVSEKDESDPSVPGNLAKALELSQTICDRIEVERRKGKSGPQNKSKAPELNIPFMLAFRVLYNIAVIYLLVGSIQQSTLEIAIILSVFPIPNDLDEQTFIADEADCSTISTIFQDHEFGLMRVNQVGLAARCIKHLVVSLDNESEQKSGMASIDSAMRWDEKAGNMIVLMQYGWPYWSSRTGMWDKILHRIIEKGSFKNREFLEYIYVEDVLKVLQSIHESRSANLDIIPPEFALRASYRHLVAPHTISPMNQTDRQTTTVVESSSSRAISHRNGDNSDDTHGDDDDDDTTGSIASPGGRSAPPPTYQPSFANQVLPSKSMSPSWYAASTQNSAYTNWMSPSFYYSRPATSVILPKKRKGRQDDDDYQQTDDQQQWNEQSYQPDSRDGSMADRQSGIKEPISPSFVPRDIVSRCLDYRLRRYSPKVTPQRMRHVLQNFLKNMVLKGNDES